MIRIENRHLSASFWTKGAELKSLQSVANGKEWMWKADPNFWGKTSPVLFPIVGGLKNQTYTYKGTAYQLPRHGFARDMEFEVRTLEADKVIFGLSSSPDSRAVYPFDFDLEVEYALLGNALKVDYRVKNISREEIYFSLGAHPAFAVEVNSEKTFADYKLEFENDEVLRLHPLRNNLLQRETVDLPLKDSTLKMSYPLFANDALVMTDLQSKSIVLSNNKDGEKLRFRFSNFPYFGIWSAAHADFVCLEPWAGIADFEDHDGDLTRKFGIIKLNPSVEWSAEWSVEVDDGTVAE